MAGTYICFRSKRTQFEQNVEKRAFEFDGEYLYSVDMTRPIKFIILASCIALGSAAFPHSGGLDKEGCHAGSQPYHCHREQNSAKSKLPKAGTKLTGTVTHVRDGDTVEVNGIPIRLAALDCPEKGTQKGDYATKIAKQFKGLKMTCELTGARTHDRLVGYCKVSGIDFGRYMMQNSSCKVWEKYDVWDRY